MSFALASQPEAPKYTTVSQFSLYRLGQHPTLAVQLTETTEDAVYLTVTSMQLATKAQPTDPDVYLGFFAGGTGASPSTHRLGRSLVGEKIVSTADQSVLGTVATHDLASDYITLQTAPTTDLTNLTYVVNLTNAMGVTALKGAAGGREWTVTMSMADPTAANYLRNLMGGFHVKAALAVLQALGHTNTVAEVQAAVMGLSENVESMLASSFEQIEIDRRNGTLPMFNVMGMIP